MPKDRLVSGTVVVFWYDSKKNLFLQDMDVKLDLILVMVIELLLECVCGIQRGKLWETIRKRSLITTWLMVNGGLIFFTIGNNIGYPDFYT